MFKFFKRLFSKDTVEAIDDAVGDVAFEAGRAFAEAELQRALNNIDGEAAAIGDPSRRAAVLDGVAAIRRAATALIAAISEEVGR